MAKYIGLCSGCDYIVTLEVTRSVGSKTTVGCTHKKGKQVPMVWYRLEEVKRGKKKTKKG